MEIGVQKAEELVRRELGRGEEELGGILGAVQRGEMPRQEAEERARKLRGYGVWWGGEAAYAPGKVEVTAVRELAGGLCEISAVCEMHYLSSHWAAEEGGPPQDSLPPRKAEVVVVVDRGLEAVEFRFRWRG